MANRYWVGGTATWDGTAGSKWSTTSGGAGGAAVPTSSDNVFINAASGAVTVTVSGTRNCNNIDFTGFTGTISGTSTPNLTIAGNPTFVSGMTVHSSLTTITLTQAGGGDFYGGFKTFQNITFTALYTAWNIRELDEVQGTLTLANTYLNVLYDGLVCNNLSITSQTLLPGLAMCQARDDIEVTGTFSASGNSNARLLFGNTLMALAEETAITLEVNGTFTAQYLDLMGVIGAGSASRNLSAITGNSGNAGNNSNFTFTSSQNCYWYHNTGNFSDASKWFLATNGGGGASRAPLPQDTAIFDSNSFSTAGQTVTLDTIYRSCSIFNASGVTNSPVFSATFGLFLLGSFTIASNATPPSIVFYGESSATLNTGGADFTGQTIQINKNGGTLTLDSDLACDAIAQNAGIFDGDTFNVSSPSFYQSSGNLNMGSGDWAVDQWAIQSVVDQETASLTVTAGFADTASNEYTTVDIIDDAQIQLTNVTFDTLIFHPAKTYTFFTGSSFHITGTFDATGTPGNLITILSDDPGTGTWQITQASGIVDCDYLDLGDSVAAGSALFYAGANSVNGGNNTNWLFTSAGSTVVFSPDTNLAATGASLVQRAVAFASTASLTATGKTFRLGVATFSPHGTLNATGRSTARGVVALSPDTNLFVQPGPVNAVGTFSPDTGLTAVGQSTARGISILAADTNLNATGRSAANSLLTISSDTNLAAVGKSLAESVGTFSPAGTLVGAAEIGVSTAYFVPQSIFSAIGAALSEAVADIDADTNLNATGVSLFSGVAILLADTGLAAVGVSTARSVATLSPDTGLTAVGASSAVSFSTMVADTNLTATGAPVFNGVATMAADTNMTAPSASLFSGVALMNPDINASFVGIAYKFSAATFAPDSSLAAVGKRETPTAITRIFGGPDLTFGV